MALPRIVLSGLGSNLSGLTWESDRLLRIGRDPHLEVMLRDFSVDRVHAEIKYHGLRWILRDLSQNPLYPTMVNQQSVVGRDTVVSPFDMIQVGKVQLKVMHLTTGGPEKAVQPTVAKEARTCQEEIQTPGGELRVRAVAQQSWDQALEHVTRGTGQMPRQEKVMLSLVRGNHHLHFTHLSQREELLHALLKDAITTVQAQRGRIILADPSSGALSLQATVTASQSKGSDPRSINKKLVERCFQTGESVLCQEGVADESSALTLGVSPKAMASIIAALLRTPRQRLGVLYLDRGFGVEPFSENDLYYADALAASISVGIETGQLVEQQREQFIQTVQTLARAVEVHDQHAGDHARQVTEYSLLLADELRLNPQDKYHIQIGTPLRDIGKIGIDDAILRKPGKLTAGEFEHMKTHTVKGATMLDAMVHLLPMVPIVRHHHERWDGTGYPDGLVRDQIPITARIVSVADAFVAMTSKRPYRPAKSVEEAFLELVGKAGTHFDPALVYAFLRARWKIEAMMRGS